MGNWCYFTTISGVTTLLISSYIWWRGPPCTPVPKYMCRLTKLQRFCFGCIGYIISWKLCCSLFSGSSSLMVLSFPPKSWWWRVNLLGPFWCRSSKLFRYWYLAWFDFTLGEGTNHLSKACLGYRLGDSSTQLWWELFEINHEIRILSFNNHPKNPDPSYGNTINTRPS